MICTSIIRIYYTLRWSLGGCPRGQARGWISGGRRSDKADIHHISSYWTSSRQAVISYMGGVSGLRTRYFGGIAGEVEVEDDK